MSKTIRKAPLFVEEYKGKKVRNVNRRNYTAEVSDGSYSDGCHTAFIVVGERVISPSWKDEGPPSGSSARKFFKRQKSKAVRHSKIEVESEE
jgi:hypothetical protein